MARRDGGGGGGGGDSNHIDELKELVKVSLQQAGVLGNIKAQLRAAVFKVVNQDESQPKPSAINVLSTNEDALAADLVREYLEHHQLLSSLAVLVPEAQLDDSFPGRSALAERLDLRNRGSGRPLLVELLAAHMSGDRASPGKGAGGGAGLKPPAPGAENVRPSLGSSLADLPGLPGVKPSPKAASPPKQPAEAAAPAAALGDEDEDDELSSTTKRIRPVPAAAAAAQPSPPKGRAGGTQGSPQSSGGGGDSSMEARKREMLEGAASAEKARMRAQHDAAMSVDTSGDDFGSEDIVEEDIERAEEESDVDEAPSPAHHGVGLLGNSLGESGQELSVSDRSVDGSMALEGFDVVETVGR